MRMPDTIQYNGWGVLLSVLIAVAAATLLLWAALRQRGIRAAMAASVAMGVAISGMHYTAMAAMRFTAAPGAAGMLGGVTAADFVLPLIVVISVLTFIPILSVALGRTEEQIRAEAALDDLLARHRGEMGDPRSPPRPPLGRVSWPASPLITPAGGSLLGRWRDPFAERQPVAAGHLDHVVAQAPRMVSKGGDDPRAAGRALLMQGIDAVDADVGRGGGVDARGRGPHQRQSHLVAPQQHQAHAGLVHLDLEAEHLAQERGSGAQGRPPLGWAWKIKNSVTPKLCSRTDTSQRARRRGVCDTIVGLPHSGRL